MADRPIRGLPDKDVEDLLRRLETLLDRLERATGPVAELAAQAMEGLALMYGTALARVVARAADDAPDLVPSLVDDELLHHLLALHGLHPQSARERVLRALEEIGPRLRSHGGDVELIEVKDEVARVRWSAAGCGSTSAAIGQMIEDAVLGAAPELRVETVNASGSRRPPTLIPVESLLRGPTSRVNGDPG
ncbi:NifU family protein [Actinoallomurus sp. NBC_01490]|uniref:NifU family protein n=1 Tax=Actinoallomurus sp. NBC_01490 TaxID=2903557 RepID=UPI002E30A67B|nr:NifU family protein [Actinoallomurus sp. NBC_01490]